MVVLFTLGNGGMCGEKIALMGGGELVGELVKLVERERGVREWCSIDAFARGGPCGSQGVEQLRIQGTQGSLCGAERCCLACMRAVPLSVAPTIRADHQPNDRATDEQSRASQSTLHPIP